MSTAIRRRIKNTKPIVQENMRRRRIPPREDAVCHVSAGRDKLGLDIHYINAFKGRGIFTTVPFQKGDFLLEYRGKLITKEECERRHRVYHDSLKVFMFEFKFDGKLWCVDASQEDGSLGRLVNDNHISPSAKMKILNINGKPHLCLFASRDISPGEEIDYNYGDSDWLWRCKTETSQIQKTVSCLKPQPNSFPNNDLDLKHPEPERTETSQIQKTVSCLKPQPNSFPNNDLDLKHPEPERCHNHRLVCTTISSLDKCIQCVGLVSSLKWLGYKCKDEIALSDAETKDSESESDDDDTSLTMSACGTSEPVHAVADSTNTAQPQDTVDCDEGLLTMPAASETAAPSEEKNAAQSHNSRRAPKNMWSKAEVAAVMRHLKDHINEGKLATKNECSHCKLVEDPVLAGRTVQNIRDFVRNRGLTAKRQKKMN
ncbi:uncharacterized protein LOC112431519 [Maylandia zebra]|uniref:uncharacterized protein LOC112431519 n=1 Tax=Maylandia zebra TaxID=106582 RepID=UPI00403D2991